jgi:hypothetical protein
MGGYPDKGLLPDVKGFTVSELIQNRDGLEGLSVELNIMKTL